MKVEKGKMEEEEKERAKERGKTGTSLKTLRPPDPSSSFLSQRVKAAIEKLTGGFAKIAHSGSVDSKTKFPPCFYYLIVQLKLPHLIKWF